MENQEQKLSLNMGIAKLAYPNATNVIKQLTGYPPKVKGNEFAEEMYRKMNPEKFKDSVVTVLHGDLALNFDFENWSDLMPLVVEYNISYQDISENGETYVAMSDYNDDSEMIIAKDTSDPKVAMAKCLLLILEKRGAKKHVYKPMSEKTKAEAVEYVLDFYGENSDLYKHWFNDKKGMTFEQAKEAVETLSSKLNWEVVESVHREIIRDYVLAKYNSKDIESLEWGEHLADLI